jgi:hypothetical protein
MEERWRTEAGVNYLASGGVSIQHLALSNQHSALGIWHLAFGPSTARKLDQRSPEINVL